MLIPEWQRKAHTDGMARYDRTGEARYLGRQVQATARRADGTEFPAEPTISESGKCRGPHFHRLSA